MSLVVHEDAESELEQAHEYYEQQRDGLGDEFVYEFRRGVDRIIENPRSWAQLDSVYRRYRLHRFPYGIVYRQSTVGDHIVIVAVMNLRRKPGLLEEAGSSSKGIRAFSATTGEMPMCERAAAETSTPPTGNCGGRPKRRLHQR